MSEITTMVMAEHRQVALDSRHPGREMAYELALARGLSRRGRWWQRLPRARLAMGPAATVDEAC